MTHYFSSLFNVVFGYLSLNDTNLNVIVLLLYKMIDPAMSLLIHFCLAAQNDYHLVVCNVHGR